MKERLFQIAEVGKNEYHAGSKATKDAAVIAQRLGFASVPVRQFNSKSSVFCKMIRQIYYWKDWTTAYKKIPKEATVLLQHPFHHRQTARERILNKLKKKKQVRFIALVHDVEQLREYRYNKYYKSEFAGMINRSDVLIVHNTEMRDWFLQQGVPGRKLIVLGIFDYLAEEDFAPHTSQYSTDVFIAGNLNPERSGYLAKLNEINGIQFIVYGPNPDESLLGFPNVIYGGSVPPEDLPKKLDKGYGLIWDGSGIDGCQGPAGKYLRYNNPHKLSLYLAAGLPVIIWKQAAEAGFVSEYGAGLLIDRLSEMEELTHGITEEAYRKMSQNACGIGEKIRAGYYLTSALDKAVQEAER